MAPDLDSGLKALIAKAGPIGVVRYRKNRVIFKQMDPADSVYYIEKGKVKLTVVSKQGKQAVVGVLSSGDFFGEGCMVRQRLRVVSATTLMDSSIVRLERATITRLIHEDAAFADLLLSHLVSRNLRMEADLVDQLFNSSEKRLARALLLLANFGKDDKPEEVVPKISQEMLAEIIGTTRSRVSFFMNKFRKMGFITYNGGLHVHPSLLTIVLSD
jgi:CRP/FNR family cyclic AMP-dependent transcriptional regulator